jgi:hypothetical protein
MFMAWVVAMVSVTLTDYWWMRERRQWGESASKYQQELKSLKHQLQNMQSGESLNPAALLHPTESETASPLSQSALVRFGQSPILLSPLLCDEVLIQPAYTHLNVSDAPPSPLSIFQVIAPSSTGRYYSCDLIPNETKMSYGDRERAWLTRKRF